jgi:hypothetical protein
MFAPFFFHIYIRSFDFDFQKSQFFAFTECLCVLFLFYRKKINISNLVARLKCQRAHTHSHAHDLLIFNFQNSYYNNCKRIKKVELASKRKLKLHFVKDPNNLSL